VSGGETMTTSGGDSRCLWTAWVNSLPIDRRFFFARDLMASRSSAGIHAVNCRQPSRVKTDDSGVPPIFWPRANTLASTWRSQSGSGL
jgi:hypothetical protein